MKELIRVRVQYASRHQCCKTHKRPLPLPLRTPKEIDRPVFIYGVSAYTEVPVVK